MLLPLRNSLKRSLLAAGISLLSACVLAFAENGVTDREILIGSCSDLGGPGQRGRALTDAAQAYFEEINSHGGVHGRKLRLVAYDDHYDPETTIACFRRLIERDHVFATAFFLGAAGAARVVPMAESNKVPLLGIVAGSDFIFSPIKRFVFSVRASGADQIRRLIDGAWDKLGIRRFALIYQQDSLGAIGVSAASRTLKGHHAELIASVGVPREAPEVDAAIEAVRASRPEALIVATLGPAAYRIVALSRATGLSDGKALFMTWVADPAILKAEGVIISQAFPPVSDTRVPLVAHYRRLMKARPDAKVGPDGIEGLAQAIVLVEGIRRAGKDLTRDGLVRSLESIKGFDVGLGPDARVTFDAANHKGLSATFLTVVHGGHAVSFADWGRVAPRP